VEQTVIVKTVEIEMMMWVKQKVTVIVATVQIERDSLNNITMTFSLTALLL
jgi:hypothetical protein